MSVPREWLRFNPVRAAATCALVIGLGLPTEGFDYHPVLGVPYSGVRELREPRPTVTLGVPIPWLEIRAVLDARWAAVLQFRCLSPFFPVAVAMLGVGLLASDNSRWQRDWSWCLTVAGAGGLVGFVIGIPVASLLADVEVRAVRRLSEVVPGWPLAFSPHATALALLGIGIGWWRGYVQTHRQDPEAAHP